MRLLFWKGRYILGPTQTALSRDVLIFKLLQHQTLGLQLLHNCLTLLCLMSPPMTWGLHFFPNSGCPFAISQLGQPRSSPSLLQQHTQGNEPRPYFLSCCYKEGCEVFQAQPNCMFMLNSATVHRQTDHGPICVLCTEWRGLG